MQGEEKPVSGSTAEENSAPVLNEPQRISRPEKVPFLHRVLGLQQGPLTAGLENL